MNSLAAYSKTFNQLCHMVALSRDGKTESAVDNLVITLFGIDNGFSPATIREVSEAVEVYFSLVIDDSMIQSSVDRLIGKGRLQKHNGSLVITPKTRAEVQTRLVKASRIEDVVRDEWFATFDQFSFPIPQAWYMSLWQCLKTYMAKAFYRHGVETTLLLDPNLEITANERKHLSTYLQEAIAETCAHIPFSKVTDIVGSFFTNNTEQRTRYVAQLLDATFTYFALTIDRTTSKYLSSNIPSLALFLDTNFIFGLLELSSSPLGHVTKELIDIIQSNNLPFKLYYHEKTLEEFLSAVEYAGGRLKGRKWTEALSRAAVNSGQLSGIELGYHEKNVQSPINPDIFLSKYEYAIELLNGLGFTIYRTSGQSKTLNNERYELVAQYDDFIKSNRRRGPKAYEVLNHDMLLWQTVSQFRANDYSVLNAGAFLLSIDYYLYSFDWQHLRKKSRVGKVLLPNHFLQILRPFLPVSDDFNKHFVETFAIPAFRSFETDYSETTSKILSFLSTYREVKESTALRILTNTLLCDRLQNVEEDSEEFKAILDNALVEENAQLLAQVETLTEEARQTQQLVTEKEEEFHKLSVEFHQTRESEERMSAKANTLAHQLDFEQQKLLEQATKLERAQRERDRFLFWFRVLVGIVVFLLGFFALFSLVPQVPGFASHPSKNGLYLAGVLIITGLSWSVADPHPRRRLSALGALVLGVIIELIQVL